LKRKKLKHSLSGHAAVCIAGAHRSGTSMLAKLLHNCGLYLGPENQLMPAQADNPDGFWEHLGFVALNEELLNKLGGAWDLPPNPNETFEHPRLDPLRMKARLLIEGFASASAWGWKDPRNSLTLPFWQGLLPKLKTVIIVRNPLEVAYSMRERNGTSYSFGLRLWEIYNRRVIETASRQERFVTHYDLFFEDAASELRRIAHFVGLPDADVTNAAALVTTRRRHIHFTIDQLIDARVSAEVIELYRDLLAEAGQVASASARKGKKGRVAKAQQTAKSGETDLLPGAVSRLVAFVPEDNAEIQQLRERLAQTEARHKTEIEELSAHLARTEARHKIEIAETTARHQIEVEQLSEHLSGRMLEVARLERHLKAESAQLSEYKLQIARQEQHYTAEVQRLRDELEQLRDRITQINSLLHRRSVSLAEHERCIIDLTNRLRKQLWDTRRLSHLLEDAEKAAARLRSSRRWKLANPGTAIQAKLFPGKVLPGYGHLQKIVAAYLRWRASHPEIAKIEDEIKALQFPTIPKVPSAEPATTSQSDDHVAPVSEATVPQLTPENKSPIQPPVPSVPVESIHFPGHEKVEVSIIIPVFNQFQFTHACLASLQTIKERSALEVIVVDDCSTDETAEFVPRMQGVVYLRNEKNSGFIASCNRGAEKARGKYLFFLNNDTIVTPGSLTALLGTFVEDPQAGIVGSKLVYPHGQLQEAGGIIWRNASGWNYGKFDDPEKPKYNYLREVDYCSGAALMIRKSLFQSLGGFDAKYAPAYYEDADLSFKVRKAGYKVFYQPLSKIIHYEGITGGTDLSTGTKKHQDINRLTFADIWATELEAKPVTGDFTFLNEPQPGRKNILVIDHHLPMPEKDAGSLRMFHILNILRRLGHRVTFIPDNLADMPPYGDKLRKRGIKVVYHPYIKKVRDYLTSHGSEFDAVVLSRCDFARKHIADVRLHAPQSRIIFDTVDLHFLRTDRQAELTSDPKIRERASEKRQLEYDLIDQADETWVVSEVEQKLLREARPGKSIEIVPTIVDVPGSKTPFSLRRDFLFIGGFQHTPNIDAVIFFLEKIHPLVEEHLSDAKFYIIGDKAPPEVVALATDNVIVAGLQPDVRPFFESVKLSVAPLRYGAGIKGKINLSMGFGVPVVATSLAVEGIALTDREDILIADEPENFARALIELYESEELWNRLSTNGIKITKAHYSVSAVRKRLNRLLSDKHAKLPQGRRLRTLTSKIGSAPSTP